MAGEIIHHGEGLPASPPDVVINLVAGDSAYAYTYSDASEAFIVDVVVPCCGEGWEVPDAPPNPTTAVRDFFGRIGDPEGWLPYTPTELCELEEETSVYGFTAGIGDGYVYLQDVGYCFAFYPPIPYDMFAPFTRPGAPPNHLVSGAAFVDDDGLFVFR